MTASAALRKQNNQSESPSVFNEEDIILPEGRVIAAMAAAVAPKKENDCYQKYDGGAISGGIADMAVSTAPEKIINLYQ